MQTLKCCQALLGEAMNYTYKRTGFVGRAIQIYIGNKQVIFFVRDLYIKLKPVRANMMSYPAEYPWSSYHGNALDKKIESLSSYSCCISLSKAVDLHKECYSALFKQIFPERCLKDIRNATNKAQVLGDNRFKQQIEK